MKKTGIRLIIILLALGVVLLSGCASASKLLDRAESAWAAGQYVSAIEYALSSYEKAVEKNKEPQEIAEAKNFLEDRFPQANQYMLERAENQLDGSDTEKAEAWKTFSTLVNMNRRVRDSIAARFLITEDYSEQLQKAKEVAAQIKYVKALELMGRDIRSSYIEAYGVFREIDQFVPDYRDIRILADECQIAGTYIVAISDRTLSFTVKEGETASNPDIATDAYEVLKSFIISNDHPDFVSFVTAGSVTGAQDLGAGLFLEIQGDIWVASEIDNDYQRNGSVTWSRSYGGNPSLVVTRVSDTRNDISTASLDLEQEVSIEFFIPRYDSIYLTDSMYNNQFNNLAWMSSQLSDAVTAMKSDEGEADMLVFAEMTYGGGVDFADAAQINDIENGGTKAAPIDPQVWKSTAAFINETLPAFMAFEDIDLSSRLVDEMSSEYLGSSAVKELLGNLED